MPKREPQPTFDQILESLRNAGFEVSRQGDSARIRKNRCAVLLQVEPGGAVRFVEGPGLLLGESIARLEDRGFQKYLASGERRVPALAEHLKQIHEFAEQLKAALGLTSLYNESLGTVSTRYLYDRVHGRESRGRR